MAGNVAACAGCGLHLLGVSPPTCNRHPELHPVRCSDVHLLEHVAQLLDGGLSNNHALHLQLLHCVSVFGEIGVYALELKEGDG